MMGMVLFTIVASKKFADRDNERTKNEMMCAYGGDASVKKMCLEKCVLPTRECASFR